MKLKTIIMFYLIMANVSMSYARGICNSEVSDANIHHDAIWSGAEFPFQSAQDALIEISRDVAPALRSDSPGAKWIEHKILQKNVAVIQGTLLRQQVVLAFSALRIAVLTDAPKVEIEKAEKGLAVIKERYCAILPSLLQKASNNKINSDNYFSGPKPPTEIIASY